MSTQYKSKFTEVIEASVPEEDQVLVSLSAQRLMNCSPGWRPSDAARSEVAHYHRLGAEAYRVEFDRIRGIGA